MTNLNNRSKDPSPQRVLAALRKARQRLESVQPSTESAVAIVGMSCRLPGGADPENFWADLADGVCQVRPMPAERRAILGAGGDSDSQWQGCFLDDVDQFDTEFFGISPREARQLDPQQRLLLEVAWEALESSGQAPDRLDGPRSGVFVGLSQQDYMHLQLRARAIEELDAYVGTGGGSCFATGRLAHILGIRGPNMVVDTACSSSLVAVHLACQSLRSRECDMALAGGVHLALSGHIWELLAKSGALSPEGRCRGFDASANGFGRGEGCGVVVLRRLSDAVQRRDNILAIIRGSAVNHDGASSGLTVPNPDSQVELVRTALSNARIQAHEVDYIETHGTGTSLGDPIELEALAESYELSKRREGSAENQQRLPMIIGSVKSNLGHLEAAAGIAGLIKVVLSLNHELIPQHLQFESPSPHVPWSELSLRVADEPIAWPRSSRVRVAGISSFGMSGSNAHLLIQESPNEQHDTGIGRPQNLHHHGEQLLTLTAANITALRQLAARLDQWLEENQQLRLCDVAYALNTGRAQLESRAVFCATSITDAQAKLKSIAAGKYEFDHAVCDLSQSYDGNSPSKQYQLLIEFQSGGNVDWQDLYGDAFFNHVSLPTYPFQRQSYWYDDTFEQTRLTGANNIATSDLDSSDLPLSSIAPLQQYNQAWISLPPSLSQSAAESWLLVQDANHHANSFQQLLHEKGAASCVCVRLSDRFEQLSANQWEVDPKEPEHFLRLIDCLQTRGRSPTRMVHFGAIDAPLTDKLTSASLQSSQEHSLASTMHLFQALLGKNVPASLWVVTRQAVAAGNGEKVHGLVQTPLWGMGKSLALEHPENWGGLIDLPENPDRNTYELLLQHIRAADNEDQAAIREGQRFVARIQKQDAVDHRNFVDAGHAHTNRDEFDTRGTWLVTGGKGDIGLRLAQWLVEQGVRHLVLAGRSEPNREIQQKLDQLNLQAEVQSVELDVTDSQQIERLIQDLSAGPNPLSSIIHAAGAVNYRPFAELTWDVAWKTMSAKVVGGWNLHLATQSLDLKHFVSFSSIASFWGSSGQVDYASGNQFLDALSFYRRQQGLAGQTINWGPWSGNGMASSSQQLLAEYGIHLLDPDRALDAFHSAVTAKDTQSAIVEIDWAIAKPLFELKRNRPLLSQVGDQDAVTEALIQETNQSPLNALSADELLSRLTQWVEDEVSRVLQVAPGTVLQGNKGFFKLGMDSLMAVEVAKNLTKRFGFLVPATAIFDYPTVNELASHLTDRVNQSHSRLQPASVEEHLQLTIDTKEGEPTDEELKGKLARLEALIEDV